MRELTSNEICYVSAGEDSDEIFEVIGEVLAEIFMEIFVRFLIEGTIGCIRRAVQYFYPPEEVVVHYRVA
jgi:hypothetical protein